MTKPRPYLTAVITAFALTACGGDSAPTSDRGSIPIPDRDDPSPPVDPVNKSGVEGGNFLNQIQGVGDRIQRSLAPDQIPALTDPVFVSANSQDAGYVQEEDIVLGLFINGEAKAYPHNIGWLHEITNDVVGGRLLWSASALSQERAWSSMATPHPETGSRVASQGTSLTTTS